MNPYDLSSANKISETLADIRITPEMVGLRLAHEVLPIQEQVMMMFLGFLKELSMQHERGAYINDNMNLANRAWEIREILLTNDTKL